MTAARYQIDGETLTGTEVADRCPTDTNGRRLNRGTVQCRLAKGKRTWAALREPISVAMARAKRDSQRWLT